MAICCFGPHRQAAISRHRVRHRNILTLRLLATATASTRDEMSCKKDSDGGHWETTPLPRMGRRRRGCKAVVLAGTGEGTLVILGGGLEGGDKTMEIWKLSTVQSSEGGGGARTKDVWTRHGFNVRSWVRPLLLDCVAVTLLDSSEFIVVVSTINTVTGAARYDPQWERWTEIATPPRCASYAAGVGIGARLYLMGGLDERRPTNQISVFNASSGIWEEGPSMAQPRFNFGAAALGGQIYVVGGSHGRSFDDHSRFTLDSAERYDPASRTWTMLPPMRMERSGCVAAAGADGRLYVFGGEDDDQWFESCERYDPLTRRWEWLPGMNTARTGGSAAVLGNRIFVLGGAGHTDDSEEQYTVNRPIKGVTANSPREALSCPITRGIMVDPVVATDGYSYEREAIEEWFRQFTAGGTPRSPMTNGTLTDTRLVPNHNLRSLCRWHLE